MTNQATAWAQQLGLVANPLFGREHPDHAGNHLALLDGVSASFLLSSENDEIEEATDWAWSSNVRHHVLMQAKNIVVSASSGRKETFSRASVEAKLPEFLRYLELNPNAQKGATAVEYLVELFRRHRATLKQQNSKSPPELESFLYLLALTQTPDALETHKQDAQAVIERYGLNFFDTELLTESYITRFSDDINISVPSLRKLITPLTIRHAGGALFQDAHAELQSDPIQMTLFGLSNAVEQKLSAAPLGAYYTPPGLARTLAEIAIETHLTEDSLRIHDPACGSGIFLCEAIRVLQRKKYSGRVLISGRDISLHAIQMARYAIACALHDWPDHKIKVEILHSDFFDALITNEKFDVILMNPPFLSWQALTHDQKIFVQDILEDKFAGRPDLSTAFVQESLRHLAVNGTLATLLPRGALDSKMGDKWRQSILSKYEVQLIGTFGDHGLFRHAMVSVGAAIFGQKRLGNNATMIWANEQGGSADSALRALRRKLTFARPNDERSDQWSIYSTKTQALAERKSWLPTPNALGSLLETINRQKFPQVGELFTVRQGIKTGLNEAFLLSSSELTELPKSERKFFRRVVNGEDISKGVIRSEVQMLFYVPRIFRSKREMMDAVPVFGKRLSEFEAALKKRPKSNATRWWEPIWPRPDLAERTPRILTKMFGALNMAATDISGEFLPLQAFAWMPKPEIIEGKGLDEAALQWYCRILNSRIFFLLRREFAAAITSGGQLDVSPKYVNAVPLPRPTQDQLMAIVASEKIDVTDSQANNEIVATAYGTRLDAWPSYATN